MEKVTPLAEGDISPLSATGKKPRRVALAERLSQGEDGWEVAQFLLLLMVSVTPRVFEREPLD